MKIERIEPIEITIKGLIEFDESEFIVESHQPFWYKVYSMIENLEMSDGYYAMEVSYTSPTNRAKTRFTNKKKRYLLLRTTDEGRVLSILSQYPTNIKFPNNPREVFVE